MVPFLPHASLFQLVSDESMSLFQLVLPSFPDACCCSRAWDWSSGLVKCVLQSHRSVGRSLQHSADDDANKTPSSAGTEFLRCQNDQHLHLHGSCPTQPPFGTWEPRPATLLPPWLAPSTGTAAPLQKGEVLERIPETFCDQQLTQNSLLWWLLGPLSHWSQIFIPLLAG